MYQVRAIPPYQHLFHIMGREEKAFDYLKKLEPNLMQHTKTGLASNYLANGTVAIDLGFMLVYPREEEKWCAS